MYTFLKRTAKLGLPLVIGAAALLGGCVAYPESYAPSYGYYYTPPRQIYSYPGYSYYSEPYGRGGYYGGRGYEHEEHEHGYGYRRHHDDD
ncbi:MAG: hypothetical protein M3O26_13655 [Pseudomonadota bacterium]|nr:hypothetical protein [Pseudomonadota bacterium]